MLRQINSYIKYFANNGNIVHNHAFLELYVNNIRQTLMFKLYFFYTFYTMYNICYFHVFLNILVF